MKPPPGPHVGQGSLSFRRALTLIELVVSLTISSLVVASVVSATTALSGARRTVDQRTSRLAEARSAMAMIVGDLRNVRRDPIENRPVVVGRSGGGRSNDTIDLLVISDRPARLNEIESDQHEVSDSRGDRAEYEFARRIQVLRPVRR